MGRAKQVLEGAVRAAERAAAQNAAATSKIAAATSKPSTSSSQGARVFSMSEAGEAGEAKEALRRSREALAVLLVSMARQCAAMSKSYLLAASSLQESFQESLQESGGGGGRRAIRLASAGGGPSSAGGFEGSFEGGFEEGSFQSPPSMALGDFLDLPTPREETKKEVSSSAGGQVGPGKPGTCVEKEASHGETAPQARGGLQGGAGEKEKGQTFEELAEAAEAAEAAEEAAAGHGAPEEKAAKGEAAAVSFCDLEGGLEEATQGGGVKGLWAGFVQPKPRGT